MDENYIPIRLAQLRTKKGISAREMSLSLGQTEDYISDIESKNATPSMEHFLLICEFLGISPREFFDEENPNPILLHELITELKPLKDQDFDNLLNLLFEGQKKLRK
nr:helix-turn-helix transcriptional regulator [uncultured Clostridium sp.]